MSIEESLKYVEKTPDIGVLEFDCVGEKVNKLSSEILFRFKELLEDISKSKIKCLIIQSKKKNMFIAGADINEIKALKTQKDAKKAAAGGQSIISMLEKLPMPVIASVNGPCLGGGCEMILACDYRIASDHPKTKIGLPEVRLGVLPGFGGCVRLPRIIGLPGALDIILAGKAVDGKKAFRIGLADLCVPTEILEEQTFKFAKELIQKGAKKRKKKFQPKNVMDHFMHSIIGRQVVFSQAKKNVLKQTRGNYPAPLAALKVVQKTYGMSSLERALNIEATEFGKVADTEVSKNLIHLFFLTEAIKKQTGVENPEVKPRKISAMGVLGAGTMGGGIAQLGADKGIEVRMKDLSQEALLKGLQAAKKIWDGLLKRRKITKYEYQQRMDHISVTTNYDGFKRLDLVIEAIVEDMGIKKKVISETASYCNDSCIIATNTSSLSVTEMSEGHPRPENFVGMHFFNPVHKMPLVEVIKGEKTSEEVVATIFELSKRMGKTPVVVKDGPGFLVNRLLLPYLNEAVYLLADGMSVEDIDNYYLNFGMPMGPLHLLDEIGIDVAAKVSKVFQQAFGERAESPPMMENMTKAGRLGKKSSKGFYLYDSRGKKLGVDQSVYEDLGLPVPTAKISESECVKRGVFAMINEAALALYEDKIVNYPEEVDLGMIMGTGFPPFRGGLLKYADTVGSDVIVDELEDFATKISPRFKPSNPLRSMAKTNRKFFGNS